MSEPIWSRHFAQEMAGILGFPMPEDAADGKDEALRKEGEQLVAEITETFRYLPPPQITGARDLAHFLRAHELEGESSLRPYGWPVAKLRELRDYLLFLRSRYGSAQPADEKDYWTDEDLEDLQRETWRRLEEEDPWPEDDYPLKEQGNAEAG